MDIKSIVKAVAAIFVITLVMGAALGLVYNVTKEPIEKTQEKAKQEAYKQVYPTAESVYASEDFDYVAINDFIHESGYNDIEIVEFGVALDETKTAIGYIVTVTNPNGYGGNITMMIGVDFNAVIQGVAFLELNETVGFGAEANNEEFYNQFVGKQVAEFSYTKDGSDKEDVIDALTGATITTSAVVDSINAVLKLVWSVGGV